jgi:HEAT repeat protein
LSHVRDERVVPVLIETLDDTSPSVRYSAAYALGEQGDTRALETLRHLAAHDHATTAWGTVASQALRSIAAIADRNL